MCENTVLPRACDSISLCLWSSGGRDAVTSAGRCIMEPRPCPTLAAALSSTQILSEHGGRCTTEACIQVRRTLRVVLPALANMHDAHWVKNCRWQCVHPRLVSTAMSHLCAKGGVYVLRRQRQPGCTARHPVLSRSDFYKRPNSKQSVCI